MAIINEPQSSPVLVRLEALADAFQEKLFADGLVKDRPQRSKTIAQAFVGKEAVTVLLELLHDEDATTATRKDALHLGREMAEHFHYFSHCKSTKKKELVLEDTSSDFYQFEDNLPIQVYKTKKLFPSLWDKVALLEAHLPVHTYNKTYDDCFPAREAITCLVELKLVKNRSEGTKLVRKMMDKVGCCQPVEQRKFIDTTQFQDDERLYRFVPVGDRVPPPAKKSSSSSPKRHTGSSRSSKNNSDSVTDLPPKLHHHHHRHHAQHHDDSLTSISASATSHTASLSSSSMGNSSIKDNSYFEQRASNIKERLDNRRRRQREASTNSES